MVYKISMNIPEHSNISDMMLKRMESIPVSIEHDEVTGLHSHVVTTYKTQTEDDAIFAMEFHYAMWSDQLSNCVSIDNKNGKFIVKMSHHN